MTLLRAQLTGRGSPIAGATAQTEDRKSIVHRNGHPIPFIKIGEQWKLDIGNMESLRQFPGFPARWQHVATAWRALVKEVKAGKYQSVAEVEEAMKAAELRAIAESDEKYTSHPTTRPD
jgi:hypothetical protein